MATSDPAPAPSRTGPPSRYEQPTPEEIERLKAIIKEHGYGCSSVMPTDTKGEERDSGEETGDPFHAPLGRRRTASASSRRGVNVILRRLL